MVEPISPEHIDNVLAHVSQTAGMAGMDVERVPDGSAIAIGFDMGEGRHQIVYIRYVGQTPDMQDVISFDSPCLSVKKGSADELTQEQAVDLLRRNSRLLFGHFALESVGDLEEMLVVGSSQILQTMDMEEFEAHVRSVALTADEYEKELGKDEF